MMNLYLFWLERLLYQTNKDKKIPLKHVKTIESFINSYLNQKQTMAEVQVVGMIFLQIRTNIRKTRANYL